MENEKKSVFRKNLVFFLIFSLVTIIRIVLKLGNPWIVHILSGGADDWYQDELTLSIMQGEWLGKYNWVTLSKGVSFPIFLAAIRKVGLTYGLSVGILLTITSVVSAFALYPLFKRRWAFIITYIGILYCPIFFAPSSLLIYRNAITPIIVLGVVSCAVGAYLRNDNLKKLIAWSLIASFYFPFFWFLREDSVWLLPFCIIACVVIAIRYMVMHKKIKSFVILLAFLALPYLVCFAYKVRIEDLNYKHYGLRTTSDRSKTACAEVVDLLHRIDDPDNNDLDVWVSKKSLERAIEVSPTLASVGEHFMYARADWAGGEDVELKGDLPEWVLRRTLENYGYYTDAYTANEVYKKIASELRAAFESGELQKKKAIYLSAQSGGMIKEDFIETLNISAHSLIGVVTYNQCEMQEELVNQEIDGEEYQIVQAEYLAGDKLNRSDAQMSEIADDNGELVKLNELIKTQRIRNSRISNKMVRIYKKATLLMSALFMIICLYLLCKKDKRGFVFLKDNCIWMIGIVLSVFINIYIVFLFTRFVTRDPMSAIVEYWAPSAYILFEYVKLGIMIPVLQYFGTNYICRKYGKVRGNK